MHSSTERRSFEEADTPVTLSTNQVFCDLLRQSLIQEWDTCDLENSSGSASGDDKCVTWKQFVQPGTANID
jgi:hypothetical protein